MSLVGLRGECVRLVPLDRALHLENALRWLNDPAVTATIERNFGATRRQEEEYFDRMESPGDGDLAWAILDAEERHVGLIGLHGINWRHRSATGGLVIGEPDAWGRGIATDAVRVRTRFAFEQLGLHRIAGHTIHPGMRRVYEKAGYRHEGTSREAIWRDGRWRDAELFAILDSDYFSARTG